MPLRQKKPEYNSRQVTQEFLDEVIVYFGDPYDDRIERSGDSTTLREAAEHFHTTTLRMRKLLITANIYSTSISRRIAELRAQDYTIQEIMRTMQLSRASVHSYIPYSKVIYKLRDSSLEAERQRQYRVRKKNEKLSELEVEDKLWDELVYLQGCVFSTAKGLNFTYQIKGGEMFVSRKDKSITRATVIAAYRKAVELDGIVTGPKKLGTFGASYLYPIFQRMGIIKRSGKA